MMTKKPDLTEWWTYEEASTFVMKEQRCSRQEADELLKEFAGENPRSCRFTPVQ